VDQSGGVRSIQRCRHLVDDVDSARRWQGPVLEQVMQRLPLHEAHIDEQAAVDFAPVVDWDHVRFLQNRGGMRFPQESCTEPIVIRKLLRKDLQGDRSPFAGVLGFIDLAHPAPAHQSGDPVLPDHLSDA
jgi:hypothetical protein